MTKIPNRYELRLTLKDGSPRAFRGYGFSKDDGYGDAMKQARQALTDEQLRTATVWGVERVR